MNEENVKQEVKTPVSVILDMARNEIGGHVISCMQANNIPSALMAYVLKSILLDVCEAKADQLTEDFSKLQEEIAKPQKETGQEG